MAKKILIIDDDINFLEIYSTFLESKGYETITATNGVQAYSICEKIKPRIIILDILLPGEHGYEICRKLKQMKVLEESVILIATAGDFEDIWRERFFDLGASGYLKKPIDFNSLLTVIKSHFPEGCIE